MKVLRNIINWPMAMARCFAREWHTVLHDPGALIFFVILPLMYPIAYTLIYNPEVVRELPVAVVDHDRSFESRKLVRDASASPTIEIYDYVPDMPAARDLMARGDVMGILEIPSGYGRKIGRMEQANATFYCQMSLLLRYRAFVSAITNVQLKDIADITAQRADMLGQAGSSLSEAPIENEEHMLGDEEQGFASFVMPGVLVLILQQSMLLGICLLGGTSQERRRRNRGIDPRDVPGAPASAMAWGRAFCYVTFYMAAVVWLFDAVPVMFNLPHNISLVHTFLLMLPFCFASAFLGQAMTYFVKDRESCFIVIAFTSLVYLFLSGLTWPMYAMPQMWVEAGKAIPGVWAVSAFIRMNANSATLADCAPAMCWLWGLTAAYSVLVVLFYRYVARRSRRLYGATAAARS